MASIESMPHLTGALTAFCGFSVAVIGGLAVENDGATILSRALPAMIVCYLAGAAIGAAAQVCVREHTENHRANSPVREAEERTLDRRLHELIKTQRG